LGGIIPFEEDFFITTIKKITKVSESESIYEGNLILVETEVDQ